MWVSRYKLSLHLTWRGYSCRLNLVLTHKFSSSIILKSYLFCHHCFYAFFPFLQQLVEFQSKHQLPSQSLTLFKVGIFFSRILYVIYNHCFGNKSVLVFFVESKPTPRDTSTQSRIPVLTGETQSPSPTKKPSVTGTSPTTSQQSTPTKRKLPTPGGVGQVVKEAPQVRTVPSVTTEDHDSEVCYILTLFTDCCKFLLMLVWRIWLYIESCYLSVWHFFILFISFILHTRIFARLRVVYIFAVTLNFRDLFKPRHARRWKSHLFTTP